MLQQPTTLLEALADFAGATSGFATSPRNIAVGVVVLLFGVFRLSSAWALILGALAGLSHVHVLSNAGRYSDLSPEHELYRQNITLIAAILVSMLWYTGGRTVRSLKAPMLLASDATVIKPTEHVAGGNERSAPEGAAPKLVQPAPAIDARRSNRMDHPLFIALVGGAVLSILIGFGIQVHRLPPPETPVLFGYVKQPGQGLVWRYATVECVRNGHSLEGYVWSREELMKPVNVFDLQPDISIGSLAQARDLARKMRQLRDADPICSQSNGFTGEGQSLILSFFR